VRVRMNTSSTFPRRGTERRRVVVLTGASAGVGRATARAFAEEGAAIALLARGAEGLDAAAREVRELGGEPLVVQVDVADADAIERAAATVEDALGPIDVWVNNAMTSVFSPAAEMTETEYRRVTDVTYLGAVWGTLAALRRMRPRNRGVIVQVGSALSQRSIPLQSAYCAAKHALAGFTESLRCELLHEKSAIRVTLVQLPALNTPQFDWVRSRLPRRAQPVPPIFQPEVAARAIVWSSHHARRSLWVGWPTVEAIVGNAIAPGFIDRRLARHGYDDQQTSEPALPDRPDNLLEPILEDRGAHGRFDDRALSRSGGLWMTTHRNALGLLAGLSALGAIIAAGRARAR
jgi:NAD(P)-dependent dehydrogenase (short-subunit alcohol dehydrogenase family)